MKDNPGAVAALKALLAAAGPDLIEELEELRTSLPEKLRRLPAEELFERVRRRYNFTQDEVAAKSGVTQSQVSRVEGGFDALLSTWRRVYDAMGYDVLLLPLPRGSEKELRALAEVGREPRHSLKMRARPRRRWRQARKRN